MVESPPKRVTRARAAKSADEPAMDAPVSRKITTASARAAGVKQTSAATKATKSSARKAEPKEKVPKKADEKPTKAATRVRTVAKKPDEGEAEPETVEAPKTRTRRAAVPAKESTTAAKITKPTTRTKRTAEKTETAARDEPKEEEPKRSTRGRPVGSTTRATAASAKAAAPRKKVTFEDESAQDKENIPVTKAGAKKETGKAATGIKARPVRKAAPVRSALRSRQAKDDGGEQDRPSTPPKPLSPKKIDQVAKSWSGSSEDELSRTPVRALTKSPIKAPLSVQKVTLEPQEWVGKAQEHLSPSKPVPGSAIKSPAKRLPASPFKDTLRESPKKFHLEARKENEPDVLAQPLFKDVLKQSPKKASFLASISPARQLQPNQTPLKASLLATPARRPTSPAKAALFVSPGKSTLALPAIDRSVVSAEVNNAQLPPLTPGLSANSPVTKSIPAMDLANGVRGTPVDIGSMLADNVGRAGVKPGSDCTLAESPDGALTPPGLPIPSEAPIFASQTPKFRSTSAFEDSDSEDELGAFQAIKKTPVRRTRRSNRYSTTTNTPATNATGAFSTSAKTADLPITPLAVQLSNWLASSPEEREEPLHEDETEAGLLPADLHASNRVSLASQESTTTASTSPRFFAEQMAVHDIAVQVHEDHDDTEANDLVMIDADAADLEQASESTDHFGDENAVPFGAPVAVGAPVFACEGSTPRTALAEAVLLDDIMQNEEMSDESVIVTPAAQQVHPVQPRPEAIFATPLRQSPSKRREVYTVSKVPLRPEGSRSPVKTLKKRSKSMANPNGLDAVQALAQARNIVFTRDAPVTSDEDLEDPIEDAVQQVTPRPTLSSRPPATMPAKARKISARPSNSVSPIKVPKKRTKSLANRSEFEQDPRTLLQPSTSFESPDGEELEDELASLATPRVVLSEVPPATMPVNGRKVPLRLEGDDSPIKIPKKRGKSMGAPLGELSLPLEPKFEQSNNLYPMLPGVSDASVADFPTPGTVNAASPRDTPSPTTLYGSITPSRAHRAGADAQILKGAVVLVDVHTTEGADASGIFVDLLAQMGARCVKQWTWNPRASGAGRLGASAPNSPDASGAPGKVGITHVVFKDGGKRTLQKVREARGLVLCVGVGWVLECVSPPLYLIVCSD